MELFLCSCLGKFLKSSSTFNFYIISLLITNSRKFAVCFWCKSYSSSTIPNVNSSQYLNTIPFNEYLNTSPIHNFSFRLISMNIRTFSFSNENNYFKIISASNNLWESFICISSLRRKISDPKITKIKFQNSIYLHPINA